jgi:hypothetical protein
VSDKPNFLLVPIDPEPEPGETAKPGSLIERMLSWLSGHLAPESRGAFAAPENASADQPRLVFAIDATASREHAWTAARQLTDALFSGLPGALEVALAVHGGGRLHTFTPFTSEPDSLRDQAAGIYCIAGTTQLLPIMVRARDEPGLRVVLYIGDVFEESLGRGRKLADALGSRGVRLIVLHDACHGAARRDADVFHDLASRTGGCVLPFDASAVGRLRDILSATAAYAVGGEDLLQDMRHRSAGAALLLQHLRRN